jgi:hypothetical protein
VKDRCERYYGTGQLHTDNPGATCLRPEGHPYIAEDGIGHWGPGDNRPRPDDAERRETD